MVIVYISKVKVMASRVSNLETSAWQQRSIVCSNLRNIFESRGSNAIWLATAERSMSCDTSSFVKLICFSQLNHCQVIQIINYRVRFARNRGSETILGKRFASPSSSFPEQRTFLVNSERSKSKCLCQYRGRM